MFKKFPWWNPLAWLDAALQVICGAFRSIFEFFGLLSPPRAEPYDNIQVADVEDAAKDAREAQEAIDQLFSEMTPAQLVHAYCRAPEDERRDIDLTKLSVEQQDWLLRLSDSDLIMLAGSGEAACGWSVDARKLMLSKARLRPAEVGEAPQILRIPGDEPIIEEMTEDEKRQLLQELVADRHAELFFASGLPNPNPKFGLRHVTMH